MPSRLAVQSAHAHSTLYRTHPRCRVGALDSIGLRSDGRLPALNSYENCAYQTGMEDGSQLVAKFYRPARCKVRYRTDCLAKLAENTFNEPHLLDCAVCI